MEYNLRKLVASMWEHRKNKDFERKSLMTSYRGLSVKASIGMTGVISRIPWISYCAEGQETQKGIYPVLLFYGTPEFLEKNKNKTIIKKIVLAYGVSATKIPDVLWGAEVKHKKTIGDSFVDWGYETSDNGIKKYNSSYVYKTYDWTDNINFNNIQKDVDQLIDIYKKIISGPNLNSMENNDNMKKVSGQLTDNNKTVINFLKINPSQIIYYGAPGTGKSYTIRKKEKAGLCCIRTTFHPDCDYATFVGCYKPHLNQELNKLTYEFVEQSFLLTYIKAWQNPQQEIALVIEEINRGNCAQIFGDLFQLLDRDEDGWSTYPIKADTDICNFLSSLSIIGYSETMKARYGSDKEGYIYLALPPNMSLLATMNTSDQSLFPIDSAFKRRWDWVYMPIADAKKNYVIEIDNDQYDWWSFLEAINTIIESTTHSEDKKLGYFFAKAKDGRISVETFVSKVIFYLWNDVFKDNETNHKAFKDSDGELLPFRKFFHHDGTVDTNMVIKFLQDLEVYPFETSDDGTTAVSDTTPNTKRQRDKSRYRVNGTDNLNKAQMTREAFRLYIEAHPDADAQTIAQAWNGLGLKDYVRHLVETEAEFNARTKDSTDTNKRATEFELSNGEKIYLSTQFGIGNIGKFIDAVNNAGWNIRIENQA